MVVLLDPLSGIAHPGQITNPFLRIFRAEVYALGIIGSIHSCAQLLPSGRRWAYCPEEAPYPVTFFGEIFKAYAALGRLRSWNSFSLRTSSSLAPFELTLKHRFGLRSRCWSLSTFGTASSTQNPAATGLLKFRNAVNRADVTDELQQIYHGEGSRHPRWQVWLPFLPFTTKVRFTISEKESHKDFRDDA